MLTERQKETYLNLMEISMIMGGNFEEELKILLSNIKTVLVKDIEKLIRKEFNK